MASSKLVNSFSLDYTNDTGGKGRLTFSIYEGSVIQTNAEAIISVDGGGGLSEAIIKAAGNTVCDDIVANKTRKLTENVVIKAGNLQCKYIIHCKCPKWNDYDNGSKKVCLDDLNITVKKALVAACDKGLKSVALPPIGLGNPFGIPRFACSAMYVKAIKEFVEFLPGMKSRLKEIQFFDKSPEMTQLVYNTYQMTNYAGERYLSPESVLMQVCQSPASTTQTSHHNGSHSTNTNFNPGQHVQHFQKPYGQAGNYQPPPLMYPPSPNSWPLSNIPVTAPSHVQPPPLISPSSSNSWPQSNIPAAAPSYVPLNWTYIGNVDEVDTFNIDKIQVLIYTGELPKLNFVDILVSTENSRVPGDGKLAKAIFQKAGKEYQKEHAKLFSGKIKINSGEILQTGAGLLHFKVVLHAIIDTFPNTSPTPYHLNELYQTTLNLLDTANKKVKRKQMLTIALPLLGAESVTDPDHLKEYASVLIQGIASFSSASNVKLWAVHIVSVKPDTTKLLVEVCRSFCPMPCSHRGQWDNNRVEKMKSPMKKSLEFNPTDYKFIESSTPFNHRKQKADFQSLSYTTQISHHNVSHSTNPSFNPGQHVQHFQKPYGQAGDHQPPSLMYPSSSNSWPQSNIPVTAPSHVQPPPLISPSSSNSWPQSNIPAAAPSYVPLNWTYIGNVDGVDTFNIDKIQVSIYTGELPKLNNVDILVSTENSRVPGNGKLAKSILQKAGKEYQREHAKLFWDNKWINSGEILQTGAGLLHFKVVLHAIIDNFPNASPTPYHLNELYQTTLNLLDTANKKVKRKQMLTIALPLLGTESVTDPDHLKEYASVLIQGITSFSSASNVRLWAVHIVSVKPDTTKLLLEVCRSFCPRPCSHQGQWDNNRVEKMKSPMKKSLEFNPTDYKFIESWTPFNHRKQKADSFFGTFSTLSKMTLHEKELTAEEGNLLIINPDSEDAMHSVQDPMIGAQCAVLNNHYICEICLHSLSRPVRLKICKHQFCRECITGFLNQKSACPVCNIVYEERYGDQPLDGIARIYKDDVSLPGYSCGTLIIHYEFPDGRQMEGHPNPGEPYCGISSQCYLPDNNEGRQILQMLRRAFEQRLIFTVGLSQTSGKENVVMRNEIHHKTKRCGGPEQNGYPDPEYLEKVKNGLSANGISED